MAFKKITNNKVVYHVSIFAFGIFLFGCNSAYAASLNLSPSSGNLTVGNILNVSILVDTDGTAINNADAVINFPTSLLEVISVSKSWSIFTLWVEEPAFSNSIGRITFNGGLPTPGFNGSAGRLVNIAFRVKAPGTASLFFSSASVRANDGLGTDVLSSMGNANYILTALPPAETPPLAPQAEAPVVSGNALGITSSTHSDQTKWYADNTPEFLWNLPSGALEVRTLIGKNPSGVPSVSYLPPINKKKIDELPDGTYYFALQVRTATRWSTVSRYRVNIDTTPPKPFSITFPHGNKGWEPQPVVFFNTTDNESGISHYEIKIGNDAKPVKIAPVAESNPYVLPPQVPGTYTLLVTAVDNAGNVRNGSAAFTIEAIDAPTITYYLETIEEGDILKIRGTTYLNSDVTVFIREGDSLVSEEHTKSNSLGDFTLVVTKRLDFGAYTVTARVKDNRGAQSAETSPFTISVQSEFVTGFVSFVLKYLSAAILALLVLGALAWGGVHLWFRIPRTVRRMRREAREAEKVSEKAFKVLRDGVQNHVARLKKLKRKLTEEEAEFLEQFEQKLEEAEEVIAKEIQDISRS